jgi:hypothetical protein
MTVTWFSETKERTMRRAKLALLFLAVGLLGLTAGVKIGTAEAAPTQPALMVSVNGVDVHRFADVTKEAVVLCYVAARENTTGSPGISCVKR